MNIDKVDTPHLSRIKEIIKRIHFADIVTSQQVLDNTGNVFYKINESDEGKVFSNLTLSYTIQPTKTGVVYGLISEETDKDNNKKAVFKSAGKSNSFNGYARFMVDVASHKVIYSNELKRFVLVKNNSFEVLDPITFESLYPVDRVFKISDFLEVIETIYQSIINVPTHNYCIYPYAFAGNDWVYDCKTLEFVEIPPKDNELYFDFFEVDKQDLNTAKAKDFLHAVADDTKSENNLKLLHAYSMYRKLNLIHPEYYFVLKDFGRTGKGLLMNTFNGVFTVNKVNFDNLTSTGFEANNEWLQFFNCDIAHANETGEINKQSMRVLRKIATCEPVAGREIGKDVIKFNIRSVLILDTNESVDTGEMTANKSRTVKISFKDRPKNETDKERHTFFKQYWDFIQPNRETSLSANLSFLINSLNYLKALDHEFRFEDVTLKTYFSADELTETQKILLETISQDGFILAGDTVLQRAIEEDYKSLRYKNAKRDIKNIGVRVNKQKKIDGQNFKVHVIENEDVFNQTLQLVEQEWVTD